MTAQTAATNQIYIPAEPHQGQTQFYRDRHKHLWRALLGGTGSGKTWAGVLEVVYWCLTYPGVEGVIFEPTYGMIKRNIIPVLEDIIGPMETSPLIKNFHKGDMLITWATQPPSKTWLGSLDDPERAEGQSLDYAYLDELRLVRYCDLALKVVTRRLRNSATGRRKGYPTGAWITTTPNEPGSELHSFLENPETRNPMSHVYRMSLLDNEANLPKGYVDEVIRSHSGGEYDRFVLGLFAAVAEGILRFDYSLHTVHDFQTQDETWLVDETEEPVTSLNSLRHTSYGHDFGWTNPAAQVAVKWDGDGRVYVLDEYYGSRLTEQQLIENAYNFQEAYGEGEWHCDASEPRTIEKLNDAKLSAYPYKGKREDGIRELGSRLRLQEDGRYRLYVHRRCVNLINELQTYNPDEKTRDHAVDALRYTIMGGQPTGDWDISFARRPW